MAGWPRHVGDPASGSRDSPLRPRPAAASHHHVMALHLRLLVRQLVVLHFEAARAGGAGSGLVPARPPPRLQLQGLREPLFPFLTPPGVPRSSRSLWTEGARVPAAGRGAKQLETSRGRARGLLGAAGGKRGAQLATPGTQSEPAATPTLTPRAPRAARGAGRRRAAKG